MKDELFAFPSVQYHGDIAPTGHGEGMTLRDYFASKAMQAEYMHIGVEGSDPKFVAAMAYEVADAMLKARDA